MPYLECPGCRLSLYSAASHSSVADSCPVCGASLEGASKRFPAVAGARTLCREFVSTPGAVAGARHALDALYVELGGRLHRTLVLLVTPEHRPRQPQTRRQRRLLVSIGAAQGQLEFG